jgi:hypothetical protein
VLGQTITSAEQGEPGTFGSQKQKGPAFRLGPLFQAQAVVLVLGTLTAATEGGGAGQGEAHEAQRCGLWDGLSG